MIVKEQFKDIAKRAVDKVVAHDQKTSQTMVVDSKRKQKIESLVQEYVAKATKDKKRK
jgi:hypothetical protein